MDSCKEPCKADVNATACVSCVGKSGCRTDASCSVGCSLDSVYQNIITMQLNQEAGARPASASDDLKETGAVRSSTSCYESQPLMKKCGTQCYSSANQAQCSAACLKGVGTSSECATCLGNKIQCTVKNCLSSCSADANSRACSSCVSRSCGSCNSEKSMEENVAFATHLAAIVNSSSSSALTEAAAKMGSSTSCYESQPLMRKCGTQCYSSANQAQCSAACLKGVGVNSGCATCLGNKIQCTVKNCLSSCSADANSRACSSCVSRSCGSCNSEKSMQEDVTFAKALSSLATTDTQSANLVLP